jgi:hypothetical protein
MVPPDTKYDTKDEQCQDKAVNMRDSEELAEREGFELSVQF